MTSQKAAAKETYDDESGRPKYQLTMFDVG